MKKLFALLIVLSGCIFLFCSQIPQKIKREVEDVALVKIGCENAEGIITELLDNGFVERYGKDHELRSTFVTCQAVIEQILANQLRDGRLSRLVGAIHTPCPATPLCSEGRVTNFLTTEEISLDPLRARTVEERTVTLRELLSQGGKLLIIYPEEGLAKRTSKQKGIYYKACETFEGTLVDCPIRSSLSDDLIGATYLFYDKEGKDYLFSIQSTQANDARDAMTWRMWLGAMTDSQCQTRFNEINDFIRENSSYSLEAF